MGLAQEFGVLSGDLCDAVLDFAVPVTIIRSFPSAVVKGRANPPIEQKFTTQLSVQPMTMKELRMLPEGMRNQGRVKAYGCDELKTVATSECRIPDRFLHRGVEYQIDKVDDWVDAGNYYKFEAVRVTR